ncbi:iron-containing alcohol dehydrogenase [Streptomyces sp. NPDC054863]
MVFAGESTSGLPGLDGLELPELPTRIVFGRGSLGRLGVCAGEYGHRVLLVCGRGAMRRHGVLDAAVGHLRAAHLTVTVFDGVSANPTSAEADRAVALAVEHGCDVVVGLGGGSAIDAAKAAAVGVERGPVGPLVGTTLEPSEGALPLIAVPTTAGSGSEVTKGATVTDVVRRLKAGIRGPDLFPRVAVIDPVLLGTVPAGVAAESGFDALAHAVEGLAARRSDPVTRALALRAVELAGVHLPKVAAGDRSAQAQEGMALAALLGGWNVALAGTCLPHRMQQAMGGLTHGAALPHGRGLAVLYPAWLEQAEPHACERFAAAARALGGTDIHTEVARLREVCGLTGGLRERGFTEADLATMGAAVTGDLGNDPVPSPGQDTVERIYRACL